MMTSERPYDPILGKIKPYTEHPDYIAHLKKPKIHELSTGQGLVHARVNKEKKAAPFLKVVQDYTQSQ